MTLAGNRGAMPPAAHIFSYGLLALPLAFAGLPLYIHIPDFYTRDLGLGLATAGAILMGLRLLEAVQDPVIGYISDKCPVIQKIVMAAGLVFLLIGMGAVLVGPPAFVPIAHWFGASVAITALGLSMVSINLVMIGSLWTDDEAVRGRASGVREGLTLIGMLMASVLPGVLMLSYSKAEAFQIFYVIFAALLIFAALAFLYFYKKQAVGRFMSERNVKAPPMRLPLKFFAQNKNFMAACFLTHIAASLPAVLFLYFVTDYLGAQDKAGLFLLLYFLAGAVFMPVWLKLSGLYSAERAWLFSILLAIASFIWAFSLDGGDLVQFGIICVLTGAALGADLAFPPVMLARRLSRQGGGAYATQAYALLNLIPKIALALGTGLAFFMLDRSGFSPSRQNTADALGVLAALYALVPCLVKMASAFMVFNLGNGDRYDIQKRSFTDGLNGHA